MEKRKMLKLNFESILEFTAIVVSFYFAAQLIPFLKMFLNKIIRKKIFKAPSKYDSRELTNLLILFVAMLTLWVANKTYQDGEELNQRNRVFLDSANDIIKTSETINGQGKEFQT